MVSALAQLATLSSPSGKIAATPVDAAPSCSIVQLTAAAGHALAIWGMGNSLAAATEPVT